MNRKSVAWIFNLRFGVRCCILRSIAPERKGFHEHFSDSSEMAGSSRVWGCGNKIKIVCARLLTSAALACIVQDMTNTNTTMRDLLIAGDFEGLARMGREKAAEVDKRIAASAAKLNAEEIAAGSGPIVESLWLGGTKYKIVGVRHGVMPSQRVFKSHGAMMVAFHAANGMS